MVLPYRLRPAYAGIGCTSPSGYGYKFIHGSMLSSMCYLPCCCNTIFVQLPSVCHSCIQYCAIHLIGHSGTCTSKHVESFTQFFIIIQWDQWQSWDYALFFFTLSAVSSFIFHFLISLLLKKLKRGSLIVFILAGIICLSATLMLAVGGWKAIMQLKRGDYMGFHNICWPVLNKERDWRVVITFIDTGSQFEIGYTHDIIHELFDTVLGSITRLCDQQQQYWSTL